MRRRKQPSMTITCAAVAVFLLVFVQAQVQTPMTAREWQMPVYFSGCDAARAAGAAPIYEGEPGYRPEMDGDSDGVACEPHRSR
jgi:hypothetical protein